MPLHRYPTEHPGSEREPDMPRSPRLEGVWYQEPTQGARGPAGCGTVILLAALFAGLYLLFGV